MTHLDDDALDRGIARRSLTAAEHNVLVDTRQFMQRGDFAAARGSRTLAMEVLAAGAVAVLVIGVILVLARPASPRPQPAVTHPTASPTGAPTVTASPSPSAVPVGAAPPILEQVRLGTWWVNALTVEPGVAWAAVQSPNYGEPGRLIRIDTSTARQTASWVIGGDPIAVAAAGPYVWVANSFGDSSKVLPEQNTVEQFNAATGRLMHVYRVTDPRGLVANPTSALVVWESTDSRAQLSLLSGGGDTTIAGVPGTVLGPGVSSQSAIVVCGDEVFFAASMTGTGEMDATIYAVRPSGGAVRQRSHVVVEVAHCLRVPAAAVFDHPPDVGGVLPVVEAVQVPFGVAAVAARLEIGSRGRVLGSRHGRKVAPIDLAIEKPPANSGIIVDARNDPSLARLGEQSHGADLLAGGVLHDPGPVA